MTTYQTILMIFITYTISGIFINTLILVLTRLKFGDKSREISQKLADEKGYSLPYYYFDYIVLQSILWLPKVIVTSIYAYKMKRLINKVPKIEAIVKRVEELKEESNTIFNRIQSLEPEDVPEEDIIRLMDITKELLDLKLERDKLIKG